MKRIGGFIIGWLAVSSATISNACTICFYGDSDTPENRGLRMGILVLLSFLIIVMVAFVKFIINFRKRSNLS